MGLWGSEGRNILTQKQKTPRLIAQGFLQFLNLNILNGFREPFLLDALRDVVHTRNDDQG
jgi:hypothetical protein